jgi:ABC-type Fe3+/spermidine/putrescine transport system ATPase subunit
MKEKLIELENKYQQLTESKIDKMKAWESVYTQPAKRDLMDFCLQTNIDQALTLSFNQIQQDIWSQPMTPMTVTVLTPQNEQVELVPEEQSNSKPSVT